MIKFESVVINQKLKLESTGFVFELNPEFLNIVYCKNEEILKDLFLIATGFYKPYLGSLVYDDIDFTELNLFHKSEFIKKNIAIISDFSVYEKSLTVFNYIKNQLLILDSNSKTINKDVLYYIDAYDLTDFKNTKIKDLSYDEHLILYRININLNNAKYIIFYDIEKIIISKELLFKFERMVSGFLKSKKTVIIFSSSSIKSIFKINKKINEINIDTLPPGGETYLIRDKEFKSEFKKFPFKNFLLQLNIVLKNNWLFFLIWLFMEICFFIFLIAGISVNTSLNAGEIFTNQSAPSLFDNLPFTIFMGIANVFFLFFASLIFFIKNKNLIYFMTRRGNGIIKTIVIFMTYVFIISFISCVISLFLPIILENSTPIAFNWIAIIILMIFYVIISISFFATIFIYSNRKIIKKKDNLV